MEIKKGLSLVNAGLFIGLLLAASACSSQIPTYAVLEEADGVSYEITVYESPTWGCCSQWVVHLQENGYDVETVDLSNNALSEIKEDFGITPEIASCHTAEIEGYIIEGHVPADVIEKLLMEKPEFVGLALPGMPSGSPGMGGELETPLDILAFDQQGQVWVYTTWQ
jgi:hypothetical protein